MADEADDVSREDLDDEDAKPLKESIQGDPDKDAIDEPATGSRQEVEETAWMMRRWTSILAISIVGTGLLVLGLMQATGEGLFAPLVDEAWQQWAIYVGLILIAITLFVWGWRKT